MDYPSHLVLVRTLSDPATEGRSLARAVQRGESVRIKRGAYVEFSAWQTLDEEAQHLTRILAFAESHPGAIFSHHSAALLLGLPLIGPLPARVQVIGQRASGGRSEPGLQRRCVGFDDSEVVTVAGGIRCTAVLRTLADLAQVQPFAAAVAPLDFALRNKLVTAGVLAEYAAERRGMPGCRRVQRAFDFGDGRAASPGESLSRAVIHELGFPAPQLQTEHRAPRGGKYFTDFEWPKYRVIAEFDGKGKYTKEEYLGSKSPGEVVYEEKLREDDLRRESNSVARWGWAEALARNPVRERLLAAGLPIMRRAVRPARS
jgi:hypothetical protein